MNVHKYMMQRDSFYKTYQGKKLVEGRVEGKEDTRAMSVRKNELIATFKVAGSSLGYLREVLCLRILHPEKIQVGFQPAQLGAQEEHIALRTPRSTT